MSLSGADELVATQIRGKPLTANAGAVLEILAALFMGTPNACAGA
jgi:hypothetical protein